MESIPILVVTRMGDVLPNPITGSGTAVAIPDNDGNVVLWVNNPTASPLDIAFARTLTVAGDSLDPWSVTVDGESYVWVGPFPPFVYNSGDNSVAVTPDAGLEIAGLRF